MKNLYLEKLKKLDDEAIVDECLRHGRIMEKGFVTEEEKRRAFQCFTHAANREGLFNEREMLLTAIRVLRIL